MIDMLSTITLYESHRLRKMLLPKNAHTIAPLSSPSRTLGLPLYIYIYIYIYLTIPQTSYPRAQKPPKTIKRPPHLPIPQFHQTHSLHCRPLPAVADPAAPAPPVAPPVQPGLPPHPGHYRHDQLAQVQVQAQVQA